MSKKANFLVTIIVLLVVVLLLVTLLKLFVFNKPHENKEYHPQKPVINTSNCASIKDYDAKAVCYQRLFKQGFVCDDINDTLERHFCFQQREAWVLSTHT